MPLKTLKEEQDPKGATSSAWISMAFTAAYLVEMLLKVSIIDDPDTTEVICTPKSIPISSATRPGLLTSRAPVLAVLTCHRSWPTAGSSTGTRYVTHGSTVNGAFSVEVHQPHHSMRRV